MTAQTVSNAVARRNEDRTAIDFMMSKRPHLRTVLPKSVDVDAFVGTAAGALYGNSLLMDYAIGNVDSLYVALMKCAVLGHMPGTDEFYLTPRKDKGRGKVLGIEGYRGVIERMYRSGAVRNVIVREVCANDYFLYVEGEMDKPVHKWGGEGSTGASFFKTKPRGPMVGIYAYAELLTGAISRVVTLTEDDVLAARDSGGYKADDVYTPWNRLDGGAAHPEFKGRSMWWKTGAKRLEPWVPTSAEYRRESLRASAAAVEHARPTRELPPSGHAVNTDTGEVVDAEIVDEQDASPAGTEPTPTSAPSATPPDVPPAGEALKTAGQYIADRMDSLGVELKVQTAARIVGRVLADLDDLTPAEASTVMATLRGCKTPADLDGVLAEIEMASDPREVPGGE